MPYSNKAESSALSPGESADAKPARVLVVEDDRALRFAMCGVLRANGFEVCEAETLEEANAQIDTGLSVVVADLRLPDGEGLSLLPSLRMIDPKIVVLIVTGFGTIDLAVKALKNGAENFLTKPVDPIELLSQVRSAVARRALKTRESDAAAGARERPTSEVFLRKPADQAPAPEATLKDVEREHIRRALVAENGRVEAAARRLGVPRSTLYQKVKLYGLHVPRTRAPDKKDKGD